MTAGALKLRGSTIMTARVRLMAALFGVALAAPAAAGVPSPDIIARASAAITADAPRLTAIFKDFHQHPEIAFTETRTAGIVAKELRALGYAVTTGIGKTGVVGGSAPTWMPTRSLRPPDCHGLPPARSGWPTAAKSR